jgi:hypothetical protein
MAKKDTLLRHEAGIHQRTDLYLSRLYIKKQFLSRKKFQ